MYPELLALGTKMCPGLPAPGTGRYLGAVNGPGSPALGYYSWESIT